MGAFLLYVATFDMNVLIVPRADTGGVPDAYVERAITAPISDDDASELQLAIMGALEAEGAEVRSVNVLALDGAAHWAPLPTFLADLPAPPPRHAELASLGPSPAVVGVQGLGTAVGPLTGKTVYVSQAHGLTWESGLVRWATQRGNTNDIVEDFVNAEGLDHYLIPMLQNAGAVVFPVREPDRQSSMVIVDDAKATFTGAWAAGDAGWADGTTTLADGTDPFSLGGSRTTTSVVGASTATATFAPALPADGVYGVNLAWVQGADRASNVRVEVHHAGGVAIFNVDQRRHGSTWVYLGRFPFYAASAKVVIANASGAPNQIVSVDAVRFGGGKGVVIRGTGQGVASGPTTGRPRYEEASRYHAQFCGAPTTVYDASDSDHNDDVGNRSRYAAWQHETGEDAVFVSWHSNAPNPGRGTSTYVYGPNPPDGSYTFTGSAGSDTLGQDLQDEIVAAVKAEWEPTWKDHGLKSAYFGEVNPKNNAEMPSALVEVAFHDTPADAALLVDPRFRLTLAKGFYRGIVRYFAEKAGVAPIYLPETPVGLMVTGEADGTVLASWSAPPSGGAVTAYRVYAGRDGFGFGLVGESATTQLAIASVGDTPLVEGDRVYLSVTAVGPGGESFPTATLGATSSCLPRSDRALIVAGFERLDGGLVPREDMSAFDLASPKRLDQDKVNTYAYTVKHGEALAANGAAFDSVESDVVQEGGVTGQQLADWGMIDWFLGEESTRDETFSDSEQAAVSAALDAGARLFVSGAELAWDLDAKGTAEDRDFLQTRLHVLMASDDAGVTELEGGVGFGEGYGVEFPDVLTPQGGAAVLRSYSNGGAALVQLGPVAVMGLPFETVIGAPARTALLGDVLTAIGFVPGSSEQCLPVVADSGPDLGGSDDVGATDAGTTDVVELDPVEVSDPDVAEDLGGAEVSGTQDGASADASSNDDANLEGSSDAAPPSPAPGSATVTLNGGNNVTSSGGCAAGGGGSSGLVGWLIGLGAVLVARRRRLS